MTARERKRYRQRMRDSRTADRQAEVRDRHVKQMRERARRRGLACRIRRSRARHDECRAGLSASSGQARPL